jgi:hypothetical protein
LGDVKVKPSEAKVVFVDGKGRYEQTPSYTVLIKPGIACLVENAAPSRVGRGL